MGHHSTLLLLEHWSAMRHRGGAFLALAALAAASAFEGWTFRDDGLLVREANRDEAYTIDGFDGDYDALASAISDHVVASLERAPLNLRLHRGGQRLRHARRRAATSAAAAAVAQ